MPAMTPQLYAQRVAHTIDLPSPPIILQRLQSLLAREAASAEIAAVVEIDQAFTARILKLVNSPFYGFSRQITSVGEAITMLGLNAVHQLLLTSSVLSSLSLVSNTFDGRAFWRHSFGVGVIAKHLLASKDRDLRSEAFSSGILHDIGRLLFIRLDQKQFDLYFQKPQAVADLEEERTYFGIDHQELGFLLAKRWNFPASVTAAIRYHHTPAEAGSQRHLAATINIADLLCHVLGIGDSGSFYIASFSQEAWSLVGMSAQKMEPLLRAALDEVNAAESVLLESGV